MEKRKDLHSFFQEAANHEEIKKDLASHKTVDSLHKAIVNHGQQLGYDFTEEDVHQHIAAEGNKELSDKELDVSGGSGPDTISKANSFIGNVLGESCHC